MKDIITFMLLFILVFSAHAENQILGKWKDKSNPSTYQYEFNKDNDFEYTYTPTFQGKTQNNVSSGLWEIGSWAIRVSEDIERDCNLRLYANTEQCCFDYKFIADNLVLTTIHTSSEFSLMCQNRVLIKER